MRKPTPALEVPGSMKVDQYAAPEIKDGLPPKRVKTTYDAKMFSGELIALAERIEPGQYVEGLSAGSMGKLVKLIESRGFAAVRRRAQGESRGAVYAVTREWLAENPNV
jgi:hypothetical protein